MKVEDVVGKVSELRSKLTIPLQSTNKTSTLEEISTRIGTLSFTSKMPGSSFSISAFTCLVGSTLAKVKGSVCSFCYAQKGNYTFPVVKKAQEKRLLRWKEDEDWVLLMAIRLLIMNESYFRWMDSGDLQSLKMLTDINQVALLTPNVKHWLPSREKAIISKLQNKASNLIIRLSSPMINKVVNTSMKGILTSSVVSNLDLINEDYRCPSKHQEHQCKDCRACWDSNIPHIFYEKH